MEKFRIWFLALIVLSIFLLLLILSSRFIFPIPSDWGNRSEVIGAILGVPFTISAAIITIWLAFRVEIISRAQLDMSKRELDISQRQFEIENRFAVREQIKDDARLAASSLTKINMPFVTSLVLNAKLSKKISEIESTICTMAYLGEDYCPECGEAISGKAREFGNILKILRKALGINERCFVRMFFDLKPEIRSGILSDLLSSPIIGTEELKNFKEAKTLENLLKKMIDVDVTYGFNNQNLPVDIDELMSTLRKLLDDDLNIIQPLSESHQMKILEIFLLYAWLDQEKCTPKDMQFVFDASSEYISNKHSEDVYMAFTEIEKPLPKYEQAFKELEVFDGCKIQTNLITCLTQAIMPSIGEKYFLDSISNINYDGVDEKTVHDEKKRFFRNTISQISLNESVRPYNISRIYIATEYRFEWEIFPYPPSPNDDCDNFDDTEQRCGTCSLPHQS